MIFESKNPKSYNNFRNPKSLFHTRKYEKVFKIIERHPNGNVLELGCGTGIYTRLLKKRYDKLVAVDIEKKMIHFSKQKLKVLYCVCDVNKLPFKSSSFVFVIGISVLHHVSDYSKTIMEVKRVLKEKSLFVFCEPNKLNILTYFFQLLQREKSISRFEIGQVIRRNNLKIVKMKEILIGDLKCLTAPEKFRLFSMIENIIEFFHFGVTLLVVGRLLRRKR